MNWNTLFFLIFPYISIALCVGVTIYRAVFRPFSISSLSSQLLERKQLFWGSLSFHWGINLVLLGHLGALFLPRGLILWNAVPIRLYLLEATGLILGVWATAGMVILLYRRLTDARIRVVTNPMDLVILGLLLTSGITGILTATLYRFGSYWFTGILPARPALLSAGYCPGGPAAVDHQIARDQLLCDAGRIPLQPPGAYRHLPARIPGAPVADRDRHAKPCHASRLKHHVLRITCLVKRDA
jgi:hypothetical protein